MFDKEINNLHKTIPDSDFEKSRIEILNKYNLNKTRTEKKNIFNGMKYDKGDHKVNRQKYLEKIFFNTMM